MLLNRVKFILLSMLEWSEVFAAFMVDKFVRHYKNFMEENGKHFYFLIKIFLLRLRIEVFYLVG